MRYLPAVLIALLAFAPAAEAGSSKRTCSRSGSETVASNSTARVYTLPGRRGTDEYSRLYGCSRSLGRHVLLEVASDDDYVTSQDFSEVRLNGRMVVWKLEHTDISCKADCPAEYDPTSVFVSVRDLRARRTKTWVGDPVEKTLFVTPKGTPAWLEEAGAFHDVRSGRRVLDSGAIGGLTLRGRVLSWTNAGVAKSATLR